MGNVAAAGMCIYVSKCSVAFPVYAHEHCATLPTSRHSMLHAELLLAVHTVGISDTLEPSKNCASSVCNQLDHKR